MSITDLPAELGTAPTLTELDARHAAAVAALEAIGADRLIAERAICYVQRARELRAMYIPAPMAPEPERDECPGHPADEFSPMGQTVFCDGSCTSGYDESDERNTVERLSGGTIGTL